MKKCFLIVSMLLLSIVGFTQQATVASLQFNVIIVGLQNPLSISVFNCDPESIIVKTDNGTITLEDGRYSTTPSRLGITHFTIYQKKNGKLKKLDVITFRAREWVDPTVIVGGNTGGFIKKEMLIAVGGLKAFIGECGEASPPIIIDSFTTCILRKDTCFYKEIKNVGARFNEETLTALSNTKEGDQIFFKFIYVKLASGSPSLLMPLIFQITDKEEIENSN
jgi:hypothetical protein